MIASEKPKSAFVTGLLLFITLELSVAATDVTSASQLNKTEILVNFQNRQFNTLIYAPAEKNKAGYPLLIVTPGAGNRLLRFVRATDFNKLAQRYSFVVAFPEIDQRDDWFERALSETGSGKNAADFFRTVIKNVSEHTTIQSQQVYLSGFSTGGILLLTALCEMAEEIAAFAVVSASLPKDRQSGCKPARPVPALFIASKDDPVVPWFGGQLVLSDSGGNLVSVDSITDTVDVWRMNNNCGAKPKLDPLSNVDPADRTTVTRLIYDNRCRNSAIVMLYAIKGGGHNWPGSRVQIDSQQGSISQDINASEIIWDFFSKYR